MLHLTKGKNRKVFRFPGSEKTLDREWTEQDPLWQWIVKCFISFNLVSPFSNQDISI